MATADSGTRAGALEGINVAGFRIVSVLGRDADGTALCLATDPQTAEQVTLRLERSHGDADRAARFLREARVLAGLKHPCLPPVRTVGEAPEGSYIVTDKVPGRSVASVADMGLPLRRILRLLGDVASALDAAHSVDLLHRQLRPANMVIGEWVVVRTSLVHFSLGRPRDGGSAGFDSEQAPYASPEELRSGEPVGPAADRYAFACTLFELLAGSPPFGVARHAAVNGHLKLSPPRVSDVRAALPPGLDAVFRRALAKAPDKRYGSAVDLVSDAQRALSKQAAPALSAKAAPARRSTIERKVEPGHLPPSAPQPSRPPRSPSPRPSPPPEPSSPPAPTPSPRVSPVPSSPRTRNAPTGPARKVPLPSSKQRPQPGFLTAIKAKFDSRFAKADRASRSSLEREFEPGRTPPPTPRPSAPPRTPPAPNRPRTPSAPPEPPPKEAPLPSGKEDPKLSFVKAIEAKLESESRAVPAAATARRSRPEPTPPTAPEPRRARTTPESRAHPPTGLARLGGFAKTIIPLRASVAVIAAAALGGLILSSLIGRDQPSARTATAGPLALKVPDGWRRSASIPRLGALKLERAVAIAPDSSGGVAVGIVPGRQTELDPMRVAREVEGSPPSPSAVRLGRFEAYRWRGLRTPNPRRLVELFVAPTSAGTLTVACYSGGAMARVPATCDRAASSVRLAGAQGYSPVRATAWRKDVADTMRGLQERSSAGLRRLSTAANPRAQARVALSLAKSYRATIARLGAGPVPPQATEARRRIVAAVNGLERAYRRLARAARKADRSGYSRAAQGIGRENARLRRVLRSI